MKRIQLIVGNEITNFTNDVYLINGTLKNGKSCSALSCPSERIKNIQEYISSKSIIFNVNNHFISPFLGYDIIKDRLFFIYQISKFKTLYNWIDENNDMEQLEENKIKAFSMIYQICYSIYDFNKSGNSIGSIPLQHIMLTENNHPIIYGCGLQEIFEDSIVSYENDCKEALLIAQKILPSTYENASYINFCEDIINLEKNLPAPREAILSKIKPIIKYANEYFEPLSDNNNDSDLEDISISSETNSQNKNDIENNEDLSINVTDSDIQKNDDSINENFSDNDISNQNESDMQTNYNDNNNDNDNDDNDNGNNDNDNNDNGNNDNDDYNNENYQEQIEEIYDTSNPTKNIEYWKRGHYGLSYNNINSKLKKIDEIDNCIIYENNAIGLKDVSIDYSKYVNINKKNLETKETPQKEVFSLEQKTEIVKDYPNNEGVIGYYIYFKNEPIHNLIKNYGPTEKTIIVIRSVFSLILVETIYGGHGFLNKYFFVAKKGFKSKIPKVRILYAGLKDILKEKTDDMIKAKEVFNELGLSTPVLLEKMSRHTSFIKLFKDLVSDFSWFHQNSDVNAVFLNIFSYIVIGYHPLKNYYGFFSNLITIEELDLFCMMYHYKEAYYSLNINKNPVIAVKSRDDYRYTRVLSPDEDQNDEKVSQFQKIDPETLNDDDLAYWAYCKVTGNHLIKNVEEGTNLLRRAKEKSAEAKYYLALVTNDDELLMKACEEKFPQAMVKIATKDGLNLELIQQAALLGNIDAIYYIGLYYFERKDYNMAYGFWNKAADLNHPDAQWRFAMMLEKSLVSKVQDIESAEIYYLASASQKNPLGLYHYSRFEETYNDMDCYALYKIADDLGVIDAKIPVIAHDISSKEMTANEIFDLVDSYDSSISTELLFRIAYSLPKSKEELATTLRKKAKSQMKEDEPDKFYAGFGLSSVFSCLREMTELSCDWQGMFHIGVKRISPANKVLCWSKDFPNPTIDTISLISQEALINLPKDSMKIRNKFTKLSKQKEYNNDPFFLFFYLLHINNFHAVVDPRLENFVTVTKEKLSKLNYNPYLFIFERKKIKGSSIIGDGRKKYILKLIKNDTKQEDNAENKRRELRMKGIVDTNINPLNKKTSSFTKPKASKNDVLLVMKEYPQLLYDEPCKFYRFSQFHNEDSRIESPYKKVMNEAFPSSKYWINLYNKQEYTKEFVIETIQDTKQFKMERSINIISSKVGIICTYYNIDHKEEALLNHFKLEKQFDGIIYTDKKKYDGNNLVLHFNIKEIKPIIPNPDASPLEKSLLLAEILKQLFTMQAIGSKHGNITKESFILADDKISIFGCDLVEFLDRLQPETDLQNAKIALQEIIPDIPKNIIDMFNEQNDFICIYQTIMLNPVQYLYENTPIDEFYDKHTPFQFHDFNMHIYHLRKDYDSPLFCMNTSGLNCLFHNQNPTDFISPINFELALSFCKDSNITNLIYSYKQYSDYLNEFIENAKEKELNERDLAYYTYIKRKENQDNMEYQNTPLGNRMKLIEQIQKIEKDAIEEYKNQDLKAMSLKVKQLIHAGDGNVINLYGLLFQYGIYNPKDKEKANNYLSYEEIELPFCQFEEKYKYNHNFNSIFSNEINYSINDLYHSYEDNYNQSKSINAYIASFRCKKNVTEKDIQNLLNIQEMPYKIEAMFTAGYILKTKDIEKSKELRKEAMELYLSTEWSKYSDSLVFFNGIGFSYVIFKFFEEIQNSILKEVNVNDLFNKGCSAYKKIKTIWVLNFGEDFNIPEAVTLQLIEREQNEEQISVLYSDYSYYSKKKIFKKNMFFMFHFALFLKAHKYDKNIETKQFIANTFKKCADQRISPSSGYFYYLLFDLNYVDIKKNEGIEYLRKSVDANLIEAVYAYGVDLATGNHVVQNEPAARMYLTQIQKDYPPANTYLESHLRRNILDFKIHQDDEISSGSVSEMNESVQSKSENEHLEMAKDVGKFMMNFKDWIPLIMSIIRIIQSCSSSIGTPKDKIDSTPEDLEENETVRKIKKLFEWATTLIQKIAKSLDLDSIRNTEVSVLISVLFTFFFVFMIFSFNTSAFSSFKALVACTIFIPFAFGIAMINEICGIVLLVIGIILIILAGVVAYLIRSGNNFLKTQLSKFAKLNIYLRYFLCLIFIPLTDIILFGMFLERLFPGGAHKLVKKHEIMSVKQLKIDTYIIFIISFVVIDLFVLSVIGGNTLYIIITVLILVILIVLGLLFAFLKIDIKRLRITVNEIWMYLFVIISESIVMVIIDHLTDDEDEMNNYVKVISSIMSVIYPLILMIFFTYKLYHIWKVTHPTYFRIWIRSTISFIARFGETVKARFFFWTVVDFIYHILFSIVSAYGGPVANIIVTIIYIVAISLLRPFILVSDNILTIGEPIIVCLLNILLLATNRARKANIALGIIFLILAFVPAIVSLIWYVLKERGNEFDFLKKDMIHEYDRVEQKEGLNVVSGVSEIVGYDEYKHLYTIWPGKFTEADIPELDFKNRLIETYGKNDFIYINAVALMICYLMMYLWIGVRYLRY